MQPAQRGWFLSGFRLPSRSKHLFGWYRPARMFASRNPLFLKGIFLARP